MRIAIVTSTRADFGILVPVFHALRDAFDPRWIVTGTHLSQLHGRTIAEIEAQGLPIEATFDIQLADDSARAIAKSAGLAILGATDALERVRPDLVMLVGDRYEILAVATTAALLHVPVAHLSGGDTTEGALDDSFRHAVTKLAHLHFTTNRRATELVLQLGEERERVHEVGHPALDAIAAHRPSSRADLFAAIGIEPAERLAALTYHPPTTALDRAERELDEILAALDARPDFAVVISGSNADEAANRISTRLHAFAARRQKTVFRASLGQARFYDLLHHADVMIGNSSSGILEAPSFRTPTINVGDRQRGRPRAASVLDVKTDRAAIGEALARALELDLDGLVSPFGDGHAARRIAEVLSRVGDPRGLLQKRFVLAGGSP
jgi:UDP-N-acetylglucosamine 2-epimerase (non-hydrolysing)/GDP/UDP-N,N'-diacetylbacillosamine 2-epimerase (hydrolysing)